VVYWLWKMAL